MTLVTGFETPATSWDQDTTWQLNISSTVNIPGDPEVGVAFMAPPSGRVLLFFGGGGRDNSGTNRMLLFPELYIGTQAIPENKLSEDLFRDFAIPGEADESIYGSRLQVFTGLTPLRIHYSRLVYRVDGGNTADLFVRELGVVPLL